MGRAHLIKVFLMCYPVLTFQPRMWKEILAVAMNSSDYRSV